MPNSMVMLIFFCFRLEKLFLGKFGPKNQNCLVGKIKMVSLSWNLVPRLFQICKTQNSMVMFTFFVFDRKYLSWANFPKFKIACLQWNLVSRLGEIWSKKMRKFFSLSQNMVPGLIRICKIQWWCSVLLFLTKSILFRQIWSKN